MNIALISNEFVPFNNSGGVATFMTELAALLTKNGHKVIVFTDGGQSLIHETTIRGVTIVPFLSKNNNKIIKTIASLLPCRLAVSVLLKYVPTTSQLVYCNVLAFLTFISYRKHSAIRLVHTPVMFAPALLLSLVTPSLTIITHAQGPDELLQQYDVISWEKKLKAKIETFYMKRSTRIIPCSRAIYAYLKKKHPSTLTRLVYIPNFINIKTFRISNNRLDTNTLLFFGRLEYRKGPDLVVKAFSRLSLQYPELRLILVGEDTDGWMIDKKAVFFSSYVKSLRLSPSVRRHITFIPRIDDRKQFLEYLGMHRGIAILPSRYEPFGFAFIEAMMSGCIVIASKNGGGSEIIQNGVDGFTIQSDVNDIIACIEKIKNLQTRTYNALVSRARRKIISTYDMSRVADSYRALYNRINSNLF